MTNQSMYNVVCQCQCSDESHSSTNNVIFGTLITSIAGGAVFFIKRLGDIVKEKIVEKISALEDHTPTAEINDVPTMGNDNSDPS